MKRALTLLCFCLCLVLPMGWMALPPVLAQSPVQTGFLDGQVTANGTTMVYVVYVPRNYMPDRQWPVIMFLHGAFAGGQDGFHPLIYTLPRGANLGNGGGGIDQVAGGLGVAVMRNSDRFPCLVVFPQQPGGFNWADSNEAGALQVLEEVVVKYHGDRSRLYLTGLSLGGEGTWKLASDHPELFAAAIPIASSNFQSLLNDTSLGKAAQALKSMPIWVFHGGADTTTSPTIDQQWVAAIKAAGSTKVQYTELAGLGHNVWDMVYDDPAVIEWLFAQKR